MSERISIRRTRDYADVFAIARDPWIWPAWSGGQRTPPAECPIPVAPQREYWLIASDSKGPFGVVRYEHRSKVAIEGHFGFRRRAWGERAKVAGEMAIEWLFTGTPYLKIVGFTPACNRAALRYNERLGFVPEGLCTKAHLYDGEIVDLVMFGLTKEAWNAGR